MTPKRRLSAEDLDAPLTFSKSFHFVCSPDRCRELVSSISRRRKAAAAQSGQTLAKPIFIWEPVPDSCTPDQLLSCTNTLPLVDICSPNHAELAGFMGESGPYQQTGEISTSTIERLCEQLLASSMYPNVLLRLGLASTSNKFH